MGNRTSCKGELELEISKLFRDCANVYMGLNFLQPTWSNELVRFLDLAKYASSDFRQCLAKKKTSANVLFTVDLRGDPRILLLQPIVEITLRASCCLKDSSKREIID